MDGLLYLLDQAGRAMIQANAEIARLNGLLTKAQSETLSVVPEPSPAPPPAHPTQEA